MIIGHLTTRLQEAPSVLGVPIPIVRRALMLKLLVFVGGGHYALGVSLTDEAALNLAVSPPSHITGFREAFFGLPVVLFTFESLPVLTCLDVLVAAGATLGDTILNQAVVTLITLEIAASVITIIFIVEPLIILTAA
jgi:hypothetical protein